VRRTDNFSLSCADCPDILGASNVWSPQGPSQTCNVIALPLLSKRAFGVRTQHVAKRLTRSTLIFQLFQTELKDLKKTVILVM